MKYNEECIACLVSSQVRLCKGLGTEDERTDYLRDVCRVFESAPKDVAAPWFIPYFAEAYRRHFGIEDAYKEVKERANAMSLAILPELEEIVRKAEDPLLAALKVSRAGNFMDFAVLSEDEIENGFKEKTEKSMEQELDPEEYGRFRQDLENASEFVILGDNAGEIVFDTVLVHLLKELYPALDITYVVRGGNAQNDATMEDAAVSGMDKLVRVIGNGSSIPGTEPGYISAELKERLGSADLILSKGQANFETLVTCGLNIYYIFLCKCPKFAKRFGVPAVTGIFVNDRRNEKFEN